MPLTADANWYPLITTSRLPHHSPPLLVQRSFTNNSYSVYLTDLTFLWGETLLRRRIIQRALNEDTSIDPSEDTTQLQILLEKLKESLSVCEDEGEDHNNIDVHIEAIPTNSSQVSSTAIHLKITYELPEPLQPLVWTFRLEPLPQTQFSKKLLIPFMSMTALRSAQVQSLVRIIKDKDIVLEKLQESLKDQNIPVTSILSGSASRRRALERFDEQRWRSQLFDSKAGEGSEPEKILQRIFGVEGRLSSKTAIDPEWEKVVHNLEENDSNGHRGKDWWEEIEVALRPREGKKKHLKAFESDESESESPMKKTSGKIARDSFQHIGEGRSIAPPNAEKEKTKDGKAGKMKCTTSHSGDDQSEVLKFPTQRSKSTKVESALRSPSSKIILESKQNTFPPGAVNDSSTEDDDDLDSKPVHTTRSFPAIRGTGTSTPTHRQPKSPIPPLSLPTSRDLLFSTKSSPASCKRSKPLESSSSPSDSSPCIPPSSPPPTLNRHGAKIGVIGERLGTIGGKKTVHRESQSPCPSSPPPSEQKLRHDILASASVGKASKIGSKIGGRIGGGKNSELGDNEAVQYSEPGNKTNPPAPVEAKKEIRKEAYTKREPSIDPMDESAADKKRKELQQELEAKQRTQAKKRRRF